MLNFNHKNSIKLLLGIFSAIAIVFIANDSDLLASPISNTSTNDPDFGPYISAVEYRIKSHWHPLRDGQTRTGTVLFQVQKDGKIFDLHLDKSTGSKVLAQSMLEAVSNAAPFDPLPARAKSSVQIQFTFDYNLFSRDKIKNNPQAALSLLNKQISLDPKDVQAYIERGRIYFALKQYQKCIDDNNKAIGLDPKRPDAYVNRGLARFCIDDHQGAFADYDKALVIDPYNGNALVFRGACRLGCGDIPGCFQDFYKMWQFQKQLTWI